MKFFKFLLTFTVLIFAINTLATAQQDSTALNNIINKIKKLGEENPIEKVYLHFDKPYYAVADTIWFKAYLTMEQNLPSVLSKIVYVEVINKQDSLIQTLKLPVNNGMAYGNIPLITTNYQQGNYYIRAYTLWMMNSNDAYFFNKTIAIGEAINKKIITYANFTTAQSDKIAKTTAKILFKDLDKKPLINKSVTWKVISEFETVAKGKTNTDANGYLNLSFSSKSNLPITNGNLITEITVADKEIATASFDVKQSTNHDVQFFPEGGELISGIPMQIAYKAIKSDGLAITNNGVVVDNEGNEFSSFTSSNFGMGTFYLNAEANKTYQAKFSFSDGSTKVYDLPKPKSAGITLQISNTNPEFVTLKVIANLSYLDLNKGKEFYIVMQGGNIMYYAAKIILQGQVATVKVPKNNFPTGIIQATLFNNNAQPVSERLSFMYFANTINLALKTDLPTYKPKQKVKLTLNATALAKPVVGNFSISITDEQKVPIDEDNEITILSSLLLTSDLKGYVEKPNYYFNKPDEKKLKELDILMLTQGYRRFLYKDILADKFPPITYLPEQSMVISGTLRNLSGMPIKKGAIRLSVPGKTISAQALSNNNGLFNFPNLVIPDSAQVVINAKYNVGGANLMLMLDGAAYPAITKNYNLADEITNIDTALAAYLNNSKKQYSYLRTLKEVVIKGPSVKRPSHSDHGAISGISSQPDHLIDGARLSGCNLFITCLRTMGSGITFENENFYVTRDFNAGNKVAMAIFINGNMVDANNLNGVQASDVDNIEIFLRDDLGTVDRAYGTKGLIVINTKKQPKGTKISKQDLMNLMPQKNIVTFSPKGYSKEREFYLPKYTAPTATFMNNDLRTTIYWNPKIVTNTVGPVSFEFYNADGKGNYRAVIEGIDANGNVGRTVYRYLVK